MRFELRRKRLFSIWGVNALFQIGPLGGRDTDDTLCPPPRHPCDTGHP
jgi:hypothetical protein